MDMLSPLVPWSKMALCPHRVARVQGEDQMQLGHAATLGAAKNLMASYGQLHGSLLTFLTLSDSAVIPADHQATGLGSNFTTAESTWWKDFSGSSQSHKN